MPFMSKYKLSNSSPFGFALVVSTGTSCPSTWVGCSSMTGEIIFGYFFDNHRKSAVVYVKQAATDKNRKNIPGTPILVNWQAGIKYEDTSCCDLRL